MVQVAAQPRPRVLPKTWQFDLTLQLPAFSSADDILVILAILKGAQDYRAIPGLQDFSHSFDVLDISRYLLCSHH